MGGVAYRTLDQGAEELHMEDIDDAVFVHLSKEKQEELLRKRFYFAEKAGIAINPFREKGNCGMMNQYDNQKQIED